MKSSILYLLGSASTALAAVRGFNYASQGQSEQTFVSQFQTAAKLEGANDFTSARLYTMIQEGTANSPVSAIKAAIDTNTTLLLGLWASVAQDGFSNEITALKSAISTYGDSFASLVVGISVGSEDLYRISPTGIANKGGIGQSPDVLVDYIGQVRDAIKGTSLGSKPVGHVDTWNVYVNSSNSKVISACDFLGLDEYPYFQTTDVNPIDQGAFLFFQAYDRVNANAQGKPIWITEAGWPTSGPTSNQAVASVDNAETFWQDVACELECRNVNFWWYILADSGASPSFGVSENGKPLYNLACTNYKCGSSTSSSSGSGSNSTSSTGGNGTSSTGSPSQSSGPGSASATSGGSSSNPTGGSSTTSGSSTGPSQYTNAAAGFGSSVFALVMGVIVAALAF